MPRIFNFLLISFPAPTRKLRTPKPRPSAGPFTNSRLSAAAETHTLRKLRSPSKCRDCDSYVYFNGAECQVCGVTCHKKCLAKLTIKCGYQVRGHASVGASAVALRAAHLCNQRLPAQSISTRNTQWRKKPTNLCALHGYVGHVYTLSYLIFN